MAFFEPDLGSQINAFIKFLAVGALLLENSNISSTDLSTRSYLQDSSISSKQFAMNFGFCTIS